MVALLALASPRVARPADGSSGAGYHLGVRIGALTMTESADRLDRVFGGTEPRFGLDIERRFDRWFLRFEASEGSWNGDESLVVRRVDEPDEGPLASRSRYTALLGELTIAGRFPIGAVWEGYAGGGPSGLAWEDSNLLRLRKGGAWGGHLTLGARRPVGSWTLGGELTYTRIFDVPDDLGGEDGVTIEEDLGLLAFDLTASHGFSTGGAEWASSKRPGRFAVRAMASYVYPTASYTRTFSFGGFGPGSTLDSDQDGDLGWGAGLELRLAGPWSLVAETFRATVDSGSSVTTRRPEGDFVVRASGSIDVEGVTLAATLDLWRGRRARVSFGPLLAYLSYVGLEDGDYKIPIDRDGYNLGAVAGLDADLVRGLGAVVELEYLSLVRIDGFDSGFELYPWVLSTGLRYRW